MGWDAPWHWVIVALLVVALFGYKKLPEASRSLGRSLRIFKTEIKGMGEDDKARESARDAATATPAVVVKPVEAPPAAAPEAAAPPVAPASPATVPSADKPATGAE